MNILNMLGKPCPVPVIETKKILKNAAIGDQFSILVDNDIARENLQKLAEGLGCHFNYEKKIMAIFWSLLKI